MSEIKLTKDAAAMLQAMYKCFMRRKKTGLNADAAAVFGDARNIQQEIQSKWSLADIESACFELAEAGLLEIIVGDDSVELAILTATGISYAQSGAWTTAQAIWNILREFLPFIPLGP